jgi:hypothetical protein
VLYNRPMNDVILTPELETYATEAVAAGRYRDVSPPDATVTFPTLCKPVCACCSGQTLRGPNYWLRFLPPRRKLIETAAPRLSTSRRKCAPLFAGLHAPMRDP